MNLEALSHLNRKEVLEVMESHKDTDPGKFAIQFRDSELPAALIATQLELRRKAATKLPTWLNKKCLFTRRSLEQASSEATASVKTIGFGKHAIDLTGGLGVDAWLMSQTYEEVTYLDTDPVLCELAKINFNCLERPNVSILHSTAESFLENLSPEASFDLIYLDPDRRNTSGHRVAAFEDCQPNVLTLLPMMLQHLSPDGQIMIKASPMLDIKEGSRQLEALGTKVQAEVISIDNEVKEVLFKVRRVATTGETSTREAEVICTMLRKGGRYHFQMVSPPGSPALLGATSGQFIYEADVALYKARIVQAYFDSIPQLTGRMNHSSGYYFSDTFFAGLPAKIFEIIESWPYKPKKLKQELRKRGIDKMEITRRFFDISIQSVFQQLGVKPGGDYYLLLSKSAEGKRMAFLCKRRD